MDAALHARDAELPSPGEKGLTLGCLDDKGNSRLVKNACPFSLYDLVVLKASRELRAVTGFKHNDIISTPSRFHTRHQVYQPSFGHFHSSSLTPISNALSGLKMTSGAPRTVAGFNVERDFGYGISTKPAKPPSGEHQPGQSKASRALTLASYFVGGCMA